MPYSVAHRESAIRSLVDAIAWSSAWVAAAAATLTGAAFLALGARPDPWVVTLAVTGTLVVYSIDRLRDLKRDRATAPERTAFIERFRSALMFQIFAAAAFALLAGWVAGPRVLAVAGAVAVLGLAHRRLKRFAWAKPAYLTGAWTAVCAGMPAASIGSATGLFPVALAIGATVQANVALSNLQDHEALAARLGRRRVLGLALLLLAVAAAAAWSGGAATRPLLALPVVSLPVVALFRPSERYGAIFVDGALVLGGAIAWGLAL